MLSAETLHNLDSIKAENQTRIVEKVWSLVERTRIQVGILPGTYKTSQSEELVLVDTHGSKVTTRIKLSLEYQKPAQGDDSEFRCSLRISTPTVPRLAIYLFDIAPDLSRTGVYRTGPVIEINTAYRDLGIGTALSVKLGVNLRLYYANATAELLRMRFLTDTVADQTRTNSQNSPAAIGWTTRYLKRNKFDELGYTSSGSQWTKTYEITPSNSHVISYGPLA